MFFSSFSFSNIEIDTDVLKDSGLGQDEHGEEPSKRDPNKPAGQKAKEVENLQKPLDAADK